MATNGMADWADTESGNRTVNGLTEGMLPSAVNDAIRTSMADARIMYDTHDWLSTGSAFAVQTSTTFTIADSRLAQFPAGRRLRFVGSASECYVVSATGSPVATVTVGFTSGSNMTGASDVLLGWLTGVDEVPQGTLDNDISGNASTSTDADTAVTLAAGADRTKLDGIDTGATDDQTGTEIKSAYEGEGDTNAYTDAEKAKLTGIDTDATVDQTAADIRDLGFFDTSNDGTGSGLDADLLDGNEASVFLQNFSATAAAEGSIVIPTTAGNLTLKWGQKSWSTSIGANSRISTTVATGLTTIYMSQISVHAAAISSPGVQAVYTHIMSGGTMTLYARDNSGTQGSTAQNVRWFVIGV